MRGKQLARPRTNPGVESFRDASIGGGEDFAGLADSEYGLGIGTDMRRR